VAALRYPTASNLDEFKPIEQVADIVWARQIADLEGADLVVLPGSKHVAGDLAWVRDRGLDGAVRSAASRGIRVLGICGGLQMLGDEIADEGGVDGDATGLGLLPLRTRFVRTKRTEVIRGTLGDLPEPWTELSGVPIHGYEIRHGETQATGICAEVLAGGRGFAKGSVLGISIHGAFEQPEIVERVFGRRPLRALEDVFEGLADLVENRLDIDAISRLAGVA
jgi:adenosylcobyric acid synthase